MTDKEYLDHIFIIYESSFNTTHELNEYGKAFVYDHTVDLIKKWKKENEHSN